MTDKICPTPPRPPQGAQTTPNSFASFLVRTIWTILGVTLFIFLIFLSTRQLHLSRIGSQIVSMFVYSAFIAVPSILLLNWAAHRLGEKYPRAVFAIHAFILVCTAIIGTLAGDLLLQVVGIIPRGFYWSEFQWTLPFSIVISLIFGLSITSFETLRYKLQAATLELRTKEVEQERAYKLLAEAQLSSLESRIHPHFLFNTLNSIAALIPSDPARAEDTVGKLASLLRFSLNAQQSGLVPLSQELKIIRDYLEIEKTRFGSRLRYEIAVPDSLDSVKVPPLALQSLVENVVKHVVSQRANGAQIQILGSRESNRIHLEVLDDGPGFTLDAITPEHGLGNLIARLELLYGAAGQLEVARGNEKTVVRLAFPA
jgi:sensor histidine kinase YesM